METDADRSHFQPWKIHVQEQRRGLCHCRTETQNSQRDLPSSHSALYSGSNLFGLFPKNKSSMSVPTFVGFHGGWWIMIINIFITIQYCGFMQTSGSSGGESVVVFKEKILSIKSLLKREKKMLKHHRYAHEFQGENLGFLLRDAGKFIDEMTNGRKMQPTVQFG